MFNTEIYFEWNSFVNSAEKVFRDLGYLKVCTPYLVSSASMEAYLDGFKVEDSNYYLPTSPEFGLKKIWTAGGEFSKIFEISKSFRAGEDQTKMHLPEFTMIEVYESNVSVESFQATLSHAIKKLLKLQNDCAFEFVALPEFFETVTGFKLKPEMKKKDFHIILDHFDLDWSESDSLNDLFQRLYLQFIEPSFNPHSFIYLAPFPSFLSALSKIDENGFADRFELYFKGVEIANGYNELLDPDETLKRWNDENGIRKSLGKKPHPIDIELIKSLTQSKIKQGVGVAIGLERLFYIKKLMEGEELNDLDFFALKG